MEDLKNMLETNLTIKMARVKTIQVMDVAIKKLLEKKAQKNFRALWDEYKKKTPAFIPNLRKLTVWGNSHE